MTKRKTDTPEYERHHGMVLEEMRDMFKTISEQTQDIPAMKADIAEIKTWEPDVKLIPAIFEEVGKLREEMEMTKKALQLLGRHDKRIESLDRRLLAVEQKIT